MSPTQNIKAFTYLPLQDKKTGRILDRYIFYVSNDSTNWERDATGEFANIRSNPLEQTVQCCGLRCIC
jgi:alpha-L-fucosidase